MTDLVKGWITELELDWHIKGYRWVMCQQLYGDVPVNVFFIFSPGRWWDCL